MNNKATFLVSILLFSSISMLAQTKELQVDVEPKVYVVLDITVHAIEELQKFTNSEEYKEIALLRNKSATTKSVIVRD